MNHYYKKMKSPLGELKLVATDRHLVAVMWPGESLNRLDLSELSLSPRHAVLVQVEAQLTEYFAGKRKSFRLPIEFRGSHFQVKTWKALQQIPFGRTQSYGVLAAGIGAPRASRAVGGATGRNPLSIIVPCHRLIGKNGKLTGFAGGLKAKKFLLQLEGFSITK